jgi:hypothetical protein
MVSSPSCSRIVPAVIVGRFRPHVQRRSGYAAIYIATKSDGGVDRPVLNSWTRRSRVRNADYTAKWRLNAIGSMDTAPFIGSNSDS